LERIGKTLRGHDEDITHEALPQRWVELIQYLNEQERTRVHKPSPKGASAPTNASPACGAVIRWCSAKPERSIYMIRKEDCIAMCGLTEDEVMAIAEHEHVPEIAATAIARYLLKKPDGAQRIRDMIRDDIHEALNRGDKDHASELLMVLRHFLATHPEAQAKRADEVVE